MTKPNSQRSKPTISIIGAGRLGTALAIALSSKGYPIRAVAARRPSHARNAISLSRLPSTTLALGADQLEQLPPSDLILITTPDDVIAGIAETFAKLGRSPRQRSIFLHTSGALSSAVLAPLAKRGFHTGSLHPLVSVSDPRAGAEALRGAFYCVEGDSVAVRSAKGIVRDLDGNAFTIKPESKALYHASAVMASPHVVALFDLASEMLMSCGLQAKEAQQVLTPLVQSTVNNLKQTSPEKALTGTFARGDVATVKRHLKALSPKQLAEALKIYKLLGLHSLQLAAQRGLDPKLAIQIKNALKK
ncbi:MAG: hypothetical protein QOF62_586 [Pyrinomonadaceae bacterium]|jgi:predicted short-subunit dehydrogenase-like oxidoreductase (DUF2520 family)|nr:hypothetical protein [Pyrinomonadaceae bacterium]